MIAFRRPFLALILGYNITSTYLSAIFIIIITPSISYNTYILSINCIIAKSSVFHILAYTIPNTSNFPSILSNWAICLVEMIILTNKTLKYITHLFVCYMKNDYPYFY